MTSTAFKVDDVVKLAGDVPLQGLHVGAEYRVTAVHRKLTAVGTFVTYDVRENCALADGEAFDTWRVANGHLVLMLVDDGRRIRPAAMATRDLLTCCRAVLERVAHGMDETDDAGLQEDADALVGRINDLLGDRRES